MWSRAVGAFYSIFAAFLCVLATTVTTNRFRSTELLAMSKFLTVEAPQRVWNVGVDLNSKISNVYVRRSCWSVESQDESVGWSSVILSYPADRQTDRQTTGNGKDIISVAEVTKVYEN